MDKDKSVEDDFLAGLDKEVDINDQGQIEDDLFPEETKEKIEGEKEVVEKPLPFHKDPKVQRYIEKQLEKRLGSMKPTEEETFKKEVSQGNPDLVKAFEAIIGNDTPEKLAALKALEDAVNTKGVSKKEIQDMMIEAQREQEQIEAKEIEEALDEIEEGFEDIEDTYGITLSEKQKDAFKEFLLRIEPKGGYVEYPDFVETFEVFKNYVKANRPSNATAKALASRGMQQSSQTTGTDQSFIKTDNKETLWQKFAKLKETL